MTRWTYWRRWGGEPLRVVATYRTDPSGPVEALIGGQWTAVPGDYVTRAIAEGDAMFDRLSAAEAHELYGAKSNDSPLAGDTPQFRRVR